MKMVLDTREFGKAMRFVIATTGKDSANVLNRAGRNVTLRAMQFTPRATPARIRTDLRSLGDGLYGVINARRIRAGKHPISGTKMATAAKAFVGKRARSAGYIRIGFLKAAQAFGAGRTGKISEKGLAAQGYGEKATPHNLFAVIVNRSRAASAIALEPLQKAINFVIKDMVGHAQKTYQVTFNKVRP